VLAPYNKYKIGMQFDPASYGPAIANLLNLDGSGGNRVMPLVASSPVRGVTGEQIQGSLFQNCHYPLGAFAGVWTYYSCFDEAHGVAQDDHSVEGSFWHGILHRQEPDAGNAGYWFRRVRSHPVFLPLAGAAAEIAERIPGCGFRGSATGWDPHAFIEYCESARMKPGSKQEQAALQIQRVEWQLLFDYCAAAIIKD
jgi:hypothetical protein